MLIYWSFYISASISLRRLPRNNFSSSKTSARLLQDVFAIRLPKTSSRRLRTTSSRCVCKASSRRLAIMFWRRLQDVFSKFSPRPMFAGRGFAEGNVAFRLIWRCDVGQCQIYVEITFYTLPLKFATLNNVESTLPISTLIRTTLGNVEIMLLFSTSTFTTLDSVETMLCIWPFPYSSLYLKAATGGVL